MSCGSESGLFFANADEVRARIREATSGTNTTAVVHDAESVPSIDVSTARMLEQAAAKLEGWGVRLLLARDVGQVGDLLAMSGGASRIGVFVRVRAAARAANM